MARHMRPRKQERQYPTSLYGENMTKQSTLFPEKETPILPELALTDAQMLADEVKTAVAVHCDKIEIVGSIRRQKNIVHDIDFVVTTQSDVEWQKINEELKRLKAKPNCSGNSIIKAYLPCQCGLFQVDFYHAKPENFGIHLLIRTGSADHNMWLAGYAFSKGMRLKYSQGLIKDCATIAGADENGVFDALGLPYPQPAQREVFENKPAWMPK
jgi:DNA polymerase/3'-5' exonuclease PolX